ncbi:hypothetical protein BDW75DRAFT_216048 [Aspergillus navahoensis]
MLANHSSIDERQELQGEEAEGVCRAYTRRPGNRSDFLMARQVIYLWAEYPAMATALLAVLGTPGPGQITQRLGGILGFCGWSPYANQMEGIILCQTTEGSQRPWF